MTYTAASHQGAIEMFQLPFWEYSYHPSWSTVNDQNLTKGSLPARDPFFYNPMLTVSNVNLH